MNDPKESLRRYFASKPLANLSTGGTIKTGINRLA